MGSDRPYRTCKEREREREREVYQSPACIYKTQTASSTYDRAARFFFTASIDGDASRSNASVLFSATCAAACKREIYQSPACIYTTAATLKRSCKPYRRCARLRVGLRRKDLQSERDQSIAGMFIQNRQHHMCASATSIPAFSVALHEPTAFPCRSHRFKNKKQHNNSRKQHQNSMKNSRKQHENSIKTV